MFHEVNIKYVLGAVSSHQTFLNVKRTGRQLDKSSDWSKASTSYSNPPVFVLFKRELPPRNFCDIRNLMSQSLFFGLIKMPFWTVKVVLKDKSILQVLEK